MEEGRRMMEDVRWMMDDGRRKKDDGRWKNNVFAQDLVDWLEDVE